ncbi:MAG: preprotein translocase subunit YajC [Bacteroidaceae bacterium]|nr:preprotein translocase subunit YajC [Bacteroidaceae bacterium]
MATMLYLNPTGELVEVAVQQQSVLNFVQSSEPNLSDIPSDGAEAQRPAGMGGMGIWIIVIVFLFVMMFLPKRQDKEGEKFRNSLQLDQDVVTSTGIFGKIKSIDDVSVVLEIAQGMRIKVDKRYVNPVPVPQPAQPSKKSSKGKNPSKDEKA